MNNEQVAHNWANQTGTRGTGSNFYYDGREIYSYGSHFLAGEYLAPYTYWINDKSYSQSTSKHQLHIRRALSISDKKYYYTCSDFGYVKREFKEIKESFKAARHPWKYYDEINNLYYGYKDFHTFLNKNRGKYFRFFSYITKGSTKERRNLLNRMKYFLDKHYVNIPEWDEKKRIIEERKEAKRKREAEIRRKSALEKLDLWKSGEYHYSIYGLDKAYLRISTDGTKVQTSKGASVSIESAKILYKMIKAGKDIKGHSIDGFIVRSINGTLEIGCHSIDIDSVHEIGTKIITQ